MTDLPMTKADDDLVEQIASYMAERQPDQDGDIAFIVTAGQRDLLVAGLRCRAQLAADRDVLDDYPNLVRERNDLRAQLAAAEATIADVKIEAGYSDICSWPLSHSVTLLKARLAAAESQLQAMRKALDEIAPAVEALACHQKQCDEDGVMVIVSRQAVDEVVNAINDMAIGPLRSLTEGAGK